MKFRHISGLVIVIIGAVIGMVMAYFITSSIGAGAVLGALVGLFITTSGAVPVRRPNSGGEFGTG